MFLVICSCSAARASRSSRSRSSEISWFAWCWIMNSIIRFNSSGVISFFGGFVQRANSVYREQLRVGHNFLDLTDQMRMACKEKHLVCGAEIADGFERGSAALGIEVDEAAVEWSDHADIAAFGHHAEER